MKKYIVVTASIILSLGWLFVLFFYLFNKVKDPTALKTVSENPYLTGGVFMIFVFATVINLSWDLSPSRWKTTRELEEEKEKYKELSVQADEMYFRNHRYLKALKNIVLDKTGITDKAVLDEMEKMKNKTGD